MSKKCKARISIFDVIMTYNKFLDELREDNRPYIGNKPESEYSLREEAYKLTVDTYFEIYSPQYIYGIVMSIE